MYISVPLDFFATWISQKTWMNGYKLCEKILPTFSKQMILIKKKPYEPSDILVLIQFLPIAFLCRLAGLAGTAKVAYIFSKKLKCTIVYQFLGIGVNQCHCKSILY